MNLFHNSSCNCCGTLPKWWEPGKAVWNSVSSPLCSVFCGFRCTCGFSARTTRAERPTRLLTTGVRPAMLPKLALRVTRPVTKGAPTVLTWLTVCMILKLMHRSMLMPCCTSKLVLLRNLEPICSKTIGLGHVPNLAKQPAEWQPLVTFNVAIAQLDEFYRISIWGNNPLCRPSHNGCLPQNKCLFSSKAAFDNWLAEISGSNCVLPIELTIRQMVSIIFSFALLYHIDNLNFGFCKCSTVCQYMPGCLWCLDFYCVILPRSSLAKGGQTRSWGSMATSILFLTFFAHNACIQKRLACRHDFARGLYASC